MSNLIKLNGEATSIVENEWTCVNLPASQAEQRVQAGKVVLFKLTGEKSVTDEQIASTVIPATGNVIVPLSVFIVRKDALVSRIKAGEIGDGWIRTKFWNI